MTRKVAEVTQLFDNSGQSSSLSRILDLDDFAVLGATENDLDAPDLNGFADHLQEFYIRRVSATLKDLPKSDPLREIEVNDRRRTVRHSEFSRPESGGRKYSRS